MPINSRHPEYDAHIEDWTQCHDAYQGQSAIKAAGERYLPKIDPKQTAPEYAAYLRRAFFYEAVGRTVDGFVGAISRKPHRFALSTPLEPLLDDATMDGTSLAEFVKCLSAETLLTGRGGILIDFDEKANRPYFSFYPAAAIISWSSDGVVLMESVFEPDPADPFKQKETGQIRQVSLVDGSVVVTLWRKISSAAVDSAWQVYDEICPLRRGNALESLPWVWLSSTGKSAKISKPPLLGLVNVSISHYMLSADLSHGQHFSALPTLWVSGLSGDDPIVVGGGAVIKLSDPAARAGYAEFTGQGLGSLEKSLQTKEHQMAVLGAAVFGGEKRGVEAAETARIRSAGENSLLMGIVSAVEQSLIAALNFAAMWMGAAGDVSVKLNRDFLDQQLDGQTLVGLVHAVQAGAMSLETFLYNLQQAEMTEPTMQIDEEAAKLRGAPRYNRRQASKIPEST